MIHRLLRVFQCPGLLGISLVSLVASPPVLLRYRSLSLVEPIQTQARSAVHNEITRTSMYSWTPRCLPSTSHFVLVRPPTPLPCRMRKNVTFTIPPEKVAEERPKTRQASAEVVAHPTPNKSGELEYLELSPELAQAHHFPRSSFNLSLLRMLSPG